MRKTLAAGMGILILAILLVTLFSFKIAQNRKAFQVIDTFDTNYQQFDANGVIAGADGFVLEGNSTHCWIMIHGYAGTPHELKEVAGRINQEFGDTVYVPRLSGHAMLPSVLMKHSVPEWYNEVEALQDEKKCDFLLGNSMGASLVLRYAETHDTPKGIVLSGPLLRVSGKSTIKEWLLTTTLPLTSQLYPYAVKSIPGETIDDPEGKKEHKATLVFPLKGAAELVTFNIEVITDLEKIKSPVLIIHAENDTVASFTKIEQIIPRFQEKTTLVTLRGDHIIWHDYDKEKAIEAVVAWRGEFT